MWIKIKHKFEPSQEKKCEKLRLKAWIFYAKNCLKFFKKISDFKLVALNLWKNKTHCEQTNLFFKETLEKIVKNSYSPNSLKFLSLFI